MNICYKYDKVRIEPECVEFVQDQMRKSHVFRNDTVATNLKTTEEFRARRSELVPEVRALEQEVADAECRLKELAKWLAEYRKASRSKRIPEEHKQRVDMVKSQLKEIKAKLSVERKKHNAAIGKEMKEPRLAQFRDNYKRHCSEGGMWFGTQGRLRTRLAKAEKFKSWDGTGVIAAEMKGRKNACIISNVERTDTVVTRKDGTTVILPASKNDKKPLVRLSFSESPSTKPYIHVRFKMHRPIPDGAEIKWVELRSYKIGPRMIYSIILTLKLPDEVPVENGVAGIAFCWERRADGSFRVAKWMGSDGDDGDVVLPKANDASKSSRTKRSWWDRMDRVEDQQSRRDVAFGLIVEKIRNARDTSSEWFREQTKTAHAWKSQKHLVRLLAAWKDNRFDGDEELFTECVEWSKQDRHRWVSQSHQRQATQNQRREVYRKAAAELRLKYGVVSMQIPKLKRKTKRRQESELPNDVTSSLQLMQNRAAISHLVECIRNKCRIIECDDVVGNDVDERAKSALASGIVATKCQGSLADVTA